MRRSGKIYATLAGFSIVLLVLILGIPHARATLIFETGLSVAETYIDNLFFTASNKQDDFGTFVIPRATLMYRSRDVVITGTYAGNAQLFVNNNGADAYAQATNFAIDLPFLTRHYKQLTVKLIESFNLSPQLPAFTANPNAPLGVSQFLSTSRAGSLGGVIG
ncbi:MAG: hypothetical protein D6704_08280, partial [Nitrospirae bacterium]